MKREPAAVCAAQPSSGDASVRPDCAPSHVRKADLDSLPARGTLPIVKGSRIIALAFAAALVAPEPGFAAFLKPAAASSSAGDLPTCVPSEFRAPGNAAFEPFMVFFDLGGARVGRDAELVLKNAARIYRRFPKCILLVAAHTDGMEAASYDPQLAARRANAVIRFLRGCGVAMRTKVEVYGDTRPLVETSKGAAERQNRGVEVVMVPETFESEP